MFRAAFRSRLLAAALGLGMITVCAAPATAQISVFDPANYAQNLLSAARALEQINHQIQSLQNEAAMLQNMAKNLKPTDFPQLRQISRRLQEIDRLMAQAQGIDFRVDGLDTRFRQLFPDFDRTLRADARASEARARLDTALSGYRQTMAVQAQVVSNVADDARLLAELSTKSQGAAGAMQLGQATNQLLALATKQQLQIQNLLAAQFRAEAVEAARRAQSERDARAATKKFLGTGKVYTPR